MNVNSQIILVVEQKLSNFSHFVNKYMIDLLNNDKLSKKIFNNTYVDLIFIDGTKDVIKKEEIINAAERFKKTPIEEGGKNFLIIKNIENSTPQSINSLLKFFDNIPPDVFVIISTSSIHSVLATIKSRAQTIKLKPDNEYFKGICQKYSLNDEQTELFKYCFDDILIGEQKCVSGIFQKIIANAKEICNKNIKEYKKIFTEFNTYSDYDAMLFLKVIAFYATAKENMHQLIADSTFIKSKSLIFNKLLLILE